jgi:hypothetical protein
MSKELIFQRLDNNIKYILERNLGQKVSSAFSHLSFPIIVAWDVKVLEEDELGMLIVDGEKIMNMKKHYEDFKEKSIHVYGHNIITEIRDLVWEKMKEKRFKPRSKEEKKDVFTLWRASKERGEVNER